MLFRPALALVVLAAVACSGASLQSAAPCNNAGLRLAQSQDAGALLAAAFVASAADVASWESKGYGNGVLRIEPPPTSGPPLARVDVCWYDGAFNIGGHPFAPAGGTIRPWDRLLVLIDTDGVARIVSAGFRETTPLASPPHGP
jgi:hypothetical protein